MDDSELIVADEDALRKVKEEILQNSESLVDFYKMRVNQKKVELGVLELRLKQSKELLTELKKVKSLTERNQTVKDVK